MSEYQKIQNTKVLVTGGAGFIGSNLCEDLLKYNNEVVCLDNFSTGHKHNILAFLSNTNFRLIDGDIRDITTCKRACEGVEIVLHQAALGSVPRSINDPVTTNEVNISGFLNMILAARDAGVKRFVYAASSSTYGDSENLPKVEDIIGKPLSPYAVTKYVNELYAHVFGLNYGLECIGLRYFNVFGRRQDPNGAYAAVIPKFVAQLMRHESPVINGDGSYSRDFTYIDNVIQMNHLAATSKNKDAIGEVFNAAVGERTTLLELTNHLKSLLGAYDHDINYIEIVFGPSRKGDVSHSLANVNKSVELLGYNYSHTLLEGLKEYIDWIMTENRLTNAVG
jgi:UDP-N-acetylglucosamine 4-epimerase